MEMVQKHNLKQIHPKERTGLAPSGIWNGEDFSIALSESSFVSMVGLIMKGLQRFLPTFYAHFEILRGHPGYISCFLVFSILPPEPYPKPAEFVCTKRKKMKR